MKEPKQRKRKTTAADATADTTSKSAPRARKRGATKRGVESPPSSITDRIASDRQPHSELELAQEHIRTRAYLRYLERGGTHGRALEDWLHAEQEHHGPGQETRRR